MELKIHELTIPERIEFNYDELKNELAERIELYSTVVYSDDQIKAAKADRATLNKLKKALNDERIRREKEYMKPFNEFKAQINELISIIDRPVALIDKQVKDFEERKKQEKADEIARLWDSLEVPEWLDLDKVFDPKWLNASVSLKTIEERMRKGLQGVQDSMKMLEKLPYFSFEAMEEYKRSLDMNNALSLADKLQDAKKRREEMERREAELAEQKKQEELQQAEAVPEKLPFEMDAEDAEEEKIEGEWISFSAFLTVPQALELKEFFERRHIDFKPI